MLATGGATGAIEDIDSMLWKATGQPWCEMQSVAVSPYIEIPITGFLDSATDELGGVLRIRMAESILLGSMFIRSFGETFGRYSSVQNITFPCDESEGIDGNEACDQSP